MDYKIIITKRAKYLFDRIVGYIVYNLKNKEAGQKFSKNVKEVLIRIEDNPFQFPRLIDDKLYKKEYRVAQITNTKYIIVFRVVEKEVIILGVFHIRENIINKLD